MAAILQLGYWRGGGKKAVHDAGIYQAVRSLCGASATATPEATHRDIRFDESHQRAPGTHQAATATWQPTGGGTGIPERARDAGHRGDTRADARTRRAEGAGGGEVSDES